ncbi:hypothetical protein VE03_02450 [Pseudogymnoascus sp. 23342-1-I1]|nr:hypothetical protein VE03_02450 [Pseudogymnoascus sp. 23342-1-I1]
MAPPAYIISRSLDPIFALFIGLGAASMRINREEKELGRSTKETVDAGLRGGYRRIGFPRADDPVAAKK